MSSELIAGLAGGAVAVVAGLAAQAFGAYLAKRQRVRELAGRYLAVLKTVGYLADRARHDFLKGRLDGAELALRAQTEAIALGSELEMIGPRWIRRATRGAVNGTIDVLAAHNAAGAHQWATIREAFDRTVDGYARALSRLF